MNYFSYEHFFLDNSKEMQRMINSHIEASKIGRQIAEQILDSQKKSGESSSDSSPDPDTESSIPISSADVSYFIFVFKKKKQICNSNSCNKYY